MTQAQISIVIPCYTSERLPDIRELLDSVQSQTYKNVETLIVAERSPELANDITKYILDRAYQGIRVLYEQGPLGVSGARNLAIKQAKGDIIAFIDDDAVLFSDWAEETVKTYDEDASAIGVTGPIFPLWQEESMNWFPKEFYWVFSCTYWEMTEKTEVRNGYGTNLSFRQEAFKSGERFKTSMGVKGRGQGGWQEPGAEETEFSLRVKQKTGKRIIYNPKVKVRHKVYQYRTTKRFVAKRAYWEGYAKALLKHLHHPASSEANVLSTEHALLRRILFRLVPQTFGLFFHRPSIALQQLLLTVIVLSCVAAGYLKYELASLLRLGPSYE